MSSNNNKIVYIEDYADEYDEKGYLNENDRLHLEQLQETEREMILYQRYEHREKVKRILEKARREGRLRSRKEEERQQEQRKHESSQQQQQQASSSHAKALSDLSSKRKQRRESFPSSQQSSNASSQQGRSSSQQSSQPTTQRTSSSRSSSQSHSQSDKPDDPSFALIKQVTISRHKLVKYSFEPYFDQLVKGAFVRILLGTHQGEKVYRLALITNVKDVKPYMVEDNGKQVQTSKMLTIECGKAQDRGFSKISNTKPTESEYRFWKKATRENGGEVPKAAHFEEKIAEFLKLTKTYIYTDEDIVKMTQRKKIKMDDLDIGTLYRKLAEKKQQLEHASESSERDQISNTMLEINRAIKIKEEALKTSKRISVADINKKQEQINRKLDSTRKVREQGSQNDPFARLSSESSFFDTMKTNEDGNTSQMSTKSASQAAGTQQSQRSQLSINGTKDTSMHSLHSFDLGIELGDLPSPTSGSGANGGFGTSMTTDAGSRKRDRDSSGLSLREHSAAKKARRE